MRHHLAQLRELLRIRCADDRADGAVAACANRFTSERLDVIRYMAIYGPAVGDQVLKSLTAGIAGLHEYKDSRAADLCDIDKRCEAVVAQVRTDGQRVAAPGAAISRAQISLCVSGGRTSDVVAFAIQYYQQVLGCRVVNCRLQGLHSRHAELFEKRRLRFHGGHKRSDDVNHSSAEC